MFSPKSSNTDIYQDLKYASEKLLNLQLTLEKLGALSFILAIGISYDL